VEYSFTCASRAIPDKIQLHRKQIGFAHRSTRPPTVCYSNSFIFDLAARDTRSAQAGELRLQHKAAAMQAQMALRRTATAPQQGQQSAGAALRPAVPLAPVPASRCFQKRSSRAASRGGLRSGSPSSAKMLTQLHAPHSSGHIRPWGPHIVVQRRPAQQYARPACTIAHPRVECPSLHGR